MRTSEDQVLRITQDIADGFNAKPGKRTVLTLIDFSRAFDKVWIDGLITKLIDQGLPLCYIKWIRAYLSDRTAKVRFENKTSQTKRFKSGVPQGGVLSPILFLVFINDIVDRLPQGVSASLFADDLAIWSSDVDPQVARKNIQKALVVLEAWTKRWKMEVNTGKCQTTFFSKNTKEAKFKPLVKINHKVIPFCDAPVFLGIRFDRTLSFKQHIESLKARLTKRNSILKVISCKNYGCRKEDLRTVYLAFIQSAMEYCGAAWMPSTAATNMQKLQVVQNAGARAITGCCKSSPADLLTNEANLIPVNTRCDILCGTAVERAYRLPTDNPVKDTVNKKVKQRLVQTSWREKGIQISKKVKIDKLRREILHNFNKNPPWTSYADLQIETELIQPCSKNDDSTFLKKLAIETIEKRFANPTAIIYTDGSVAENCKNGGSGVIIKRSGNQDEIIRVPAGSYASSFRSELIAIQTALDWIRQNIETNNSSKILVLSDSQSVLKKLKSGPKSARSDSEIKIWEHLRLMDKNVKIAFQWVPGHVGLKGNESADCAAKEASKLNQENCPLDFDTAKAIIRRDAVNSWRSGLSQTERPKCNENNLSRRERVVLSQLRTGEHCPILNAYLHRIGKSDSPICKDCKRQADTWQHLLLKCSKHNTIRKKIFDKAPTADVLWREPERVIQFLRGCGRL